MALKTDSYLAEGLAMRVTTSDQITEPAVIVERATDSVLVLAAGLVSQDVVLYLDKLLSTY